jgi:hypothetical protein
MPIPRSLHQQVRERANRLCEYCHLPDALTTLPCQIDHIMAEKHGAPTCHSQNSICCVLRQVSMVYRSAGTGCQWKMVCHMIETITLPE